MGYFGPVAQLGAHYIRIVGVGSSNLLRSTKKKDTVRCLFFLPEEVAGISLLVLFSLECIPMGALCLSGFAQTPRT